MRPTPTLSKVMYSTFGLFDQAVIGDHRDAFVRRLLDRRQNGVVVHC